MKQNIIWIWSKYLWRHKFSAGGEQVVNFQLKLTGWQHSLHFHNLVTVGEKGKKTSQFGSDMFAIDQFWFQQLHLFHLNFFWTKLNKNWPPKQLACISLLCAHVLDRMHWVLSVLAWNWNSYITLWTERVSQTDEIDSVGVFTYLKLICKKT